MTVLANLKGAFMVALTHTPFDALSSLLEDAQPTLGQDDLVQVQEAATLAVAKLPKARKGPFGPMVYACLAEEQALANARKGHGRLRGEGQGYEQSSLARDELARAEKPVYPCGGFTSRSWIETPPKAVASSRKTPGLGFTDKATASMSAWDEDRGTGARRAKGPMVVEPQGYTAREDNPNAKQLRR